MMGADDLSRDNPAQKDDSQRARERPSSPKIFTSWVTDVSVQFMGIRYTCP